MFSAVDRRNGNFNSRCCDFAPRQRWCGIHFQSGIDGPTERGETDPAHSPDREGLWGVYAAISLACFFAYWAAGMSFGDAWLHMFSTMSLGGLSSHDSSFGFFNSPTLEWIAIFFMLIASGSFALYFVALHKRKVLIVFKDPEWWGTLTYY